MLDAHVHLDFMANGEAVAARGARFGMSFYACTVTPNGYATARERFEEFENVTVGLGFHPWWVKGAGDNAGNGTLAPEPGSEETLEKFISYLQNTRLVGEIGLDFGKRHASTRERQTAVFERIARECARQGGKILSIHSVHAAREAIDIMKDAGTFDTCTCIFHWYSGPSDQLKRAIDAGAFFSVGKRMLDTRKGREYVKAIPRDRLLCETDAPAEPGQTVSFSDLYAELTQVQGEIDALQRARR